MKTREKAGGSPGAPDHLLSPEEAARFLGSSAKWMRDLLREGRLSGVKIRGKWRVRRSTLEAHAKTRAPVELPEGMLTPTEVAKILGLSLQTIYVALRTGDLPGQRMGRTWGVSIANLNEYLKRCAARGAGTSPRVVEEGLGGCAVETEAVGPNVTSFITTDTATGSEGIFLVPDPEGIFLFDEDGNIVGEDGEDDSPLDVGENDSPLDDSPLVDEDDSPLDDSPLDSPLDVDLLDEDGNLIVGLLDEDGNLIVGLLDEDGNIIVDLLPEEDASPLDGNIIVDEDASPLDGNIVFDLLPDSPQPET